MNRFAMLLFVLAVGCASTESFQVQSAPDTDAFACVTKAVAAQDYTVTTAERDAGLVIAEQQQMANFALVTGDFYRVLTFNILDDGTIRAQSKRVERKGGSDATRPGGGDAEKAAREILETCGSDSS